MTQASVTWFISVLLAVLYEEYKFRKSHDGNSRSTFVRFYDLLRKLAMTGSDMLTILAAVYGIVFWANGKCTMTVYHYYVALDSILLACSTIAVAFATSSRHYWMTWAGTYRTLATTLVFVFLSIFLGYQLFNHPHDHLPNAIPPRGNDSAIFLPVSCFLDPDLINTASPYGPSLQHTLTDHQKTRIGGSKQFLRLPEIGLFIVLVVLLIIAVISHLPCTRARTKNRKLQLWKAPLVAMIFYSLIVNIYCAYHILKLRLWTSRSGWMENKGEEGYYSIGQLLPLLSLATIVITALEEVRCPSCCRRSKNNKRMGPQGYEML